MVARVVAGELTLERFELDGANVFCARLIGVNRVGESLQNARRLCERIAREARQAVILDYRQCALDHTLEEYEQVARVLADELPRPLRFAYVYGPGNIMHALFMTKALARAGVTARAFDNWEAAETFARGQIETP